GNKPIRAPDFDVPYGRLMASHVTAVNQIFIKNLLPYRLLMVERGENQKDLGFIERHYKLYVISD
ncbi:MAG: hypothetical protein AAB725_01185, partial [Patescibacteria group bacterium]